MRVSKAGKRGRGGYVAIGPGSGGQSAGPQDVTASTWCPAGWDTQVVEEQSADAETLHCLETIGYFAFTGTPEDEPPFVASMQTCLGTDTASLRCDRLAETFQMEHGTASIDHRWQTISLVNTYEHPLVLAGPATYYGLDPGIVRVRNVTSNSFEIRFQEWNYLDDYHIQEGVHYLVVERGAWQIDAGTLLVADSFGTSNTNISSPTVVPFPLDFTSAPVVVATQQTAKGGDAVTERISNVQKTRFSVALQEEEAGGAHVGETVGYVAIGPGSGGAAAGPVEITVGTGSPSGWQILVVEEKSKDSETSHCWEKVGYFALTGTPPELPPMVASMQTCYGTDTASLRCRPVVTRVPRLGRLLASGIQRLASLAERGDGACRLAILAQDASGEDIDGVAITVSAGGRTWVETCPAVLTCASGETATLTAPDSVLCGGKVLSFSHWVLCGSPQPQAGTTVELQASGHLQACAVYLAP